MPHNDATHTDSQKNPFFCEIPHEQKDSDQEAVIRDGPTARQ